MTAPFFESATLFSWYDRHGRELPWRRRWPELAPVYHVWLSEIMLQQTVVTTVVPYFLDFIRRWPCIEDLARASLDDVLAAWAGLGYYARARNLHKAAKFVVDECGGQFPKTSDGLHALPGVGPYTAGAISAIAYGRRSVVIDGNIERVMARFYGVSKPLPTAKVEIGRHYAAIMPDERPSDFPQALMDFANAVCTPKGANCESCPFSSHCTAFGCEMVEAFPVKPAKKAKETRRGIAFVARSRSGEAFLVRRQDSGMLGGMLAFPSTGWATRGENFDCDLALDAAPFPAEWRRLEKRVQHVFTHFEVEMEVAVAVVTSPKNLANIADRGDWKPVKPADLPSLMRKVWAAAQTTANG
tara:strand:- start:1521 stop:2591 length:1071 start_codon:yes stop_codon:yes gene_type:complete